MTGNPKFCRIISGEPASSVVLEDEFCMAFLEFHTHVVPRKRKDGLRGFFRPGYPCEDEAHMRDTAERIRTAVERLRSARG